MLLYNLGVFLYGLGIRIASLRKEKAKYWVKGRKNWRENLSRQVSGLGAGDRIWIHCASYGEFEQGRPLIEKIKADHPSKKIILTFFSPSGYEEFKNWKGADIILYLPLDTTKNARDFLNILKPKISIFIKYEFWLNYLRELKESEIRTYLVSATFKEHHPFFKSYGSIFRNSLLTFETLFVQDHNSAKLLSAIGIEKTVVSGDTRFDRVTQIRLNFKEIEGISEFKGNSRLIVAGSTWPKDEELVIEAFKKLNDPTLKLVLAPHNMDANLLKNTIEKLKQNNLSYSLITEKIKSESKVLIVNTIGLLSRLYKYADVAYIGGGFDGGIHNTLEPAVFGVDVAFAGGDFSKYNEAVRMVELGVARKVKNSEELSQNWKKIFSDPTKREKIRQTLSDYFDENSNVTDKILSSITLE